jgi:hypothetical protein
MIGNEKVPTAYILCLVLGLVVFYGLLLNGWGDRIEWLQNLSTGYISFLPVK